MRDDPFEPTKNELMKRALAKPLDGPKQIKALNLPKPSMPVREWGKIFTALDRDFLLWMKSVGRDEE